MASGIYSITNKITKKHYIGSTKDFERRFNEHLNALRTNSHINIKLQRSFKKHRESSFVFEIIEITDYIAGIKDREQFFIDHFDSKKNGYNIADASFGDVLTHHPRREEIISQISSSVKKYRQNFVEPHKGLKNSNYGKPRDPKVIQAMINGTKNFIAQHGHGPTLGYKQSEETRNHISEKAKLRIGEKNPFFGKSHSEKSKILMSEKLRGIKPTNMRKVKINDIDYESLTAATRETGIKTPTLLYRIRSNKPKWKDFQYLL